MKFLGDGSMLAFESARAAVRTAIQIQKLVVDAVGDASFQRSEGFFSGFAFGLFLVVVDAAGCVVADLGDGCHVDSRLSMPNSPCGSVSTPVRSCAQPMIFSV